MTDWRDTVKTQQELYDELAELKSKLQASEKLLTIARENEERTAAANRDLVSRLDAIKLAVQNYLDAGADPSDDIRWALHDALNGPVDQHPEATCEDCHGRNVIWFAANALWNYVMGGDGGIVCPICFVKRAEAKGLNGSAWELRQETVVERREPKCATPDCFATVPLHGPQIFCAQHRPSPVPECPHGQPVGARCRECSKESRD